MRIKVPFTEIFTGVNGTEGLNILIPDSTRIKCSLIASAVGPSLSIFISMRMLN